MVGPGVVLDLGPSRPGRERERSVEYHASLMAASARASRGD